MQQNNEQKKVDERSPAVKVIELLDGMDQLESKHVPDGAYKSMWDELYGLLVNIIEKAESKHSVGVVDDDEEELLAAKPSQRVVRQPEPVHMPVRQKKVSLDEDDDDLLD